VRGVGLIEESSRSRLRMLFFVEFRAIAKVAMVRVAVPALDELIHVLFLAAAVHPSEKVSREDKRLIPPVDSAVEVGIEAGEVAEDLHTCVQGLLGAASLLVAAADQHVYSGVGERM
jgi:hypothetical protein